VSGLNFGFAFFFIAPRDGSIRECGFCLGTFKTWTASFVRQRLALLIRPKAKRRRMTLETQGVPIVALRSQRGIGWRHNAPISGHDRNAGCVADRRPDESAFV
jgi:hypothetical protein